jgi:hypothetical protein
LRALKINSLLANEAPNQLLTAVALATSRYFDTQEEEQVRLTGTFSLATHFVIQI